MKKDKNVKESFFDLLEIQKETPPNLFQLFSDLPKIKNGMECNQYITSDINSYLKKYIRKQEDTPLTYHKARLNNENDLKIYKLVATEKRNGNNLHYTDLPLSLQTHNNKKSFLDRFKALDGNSVSHTIVAHISKDGHHYIHPDVSQNRSITVREAARIQTFSDDFYFESSRTSAFKQIGNAVPPVLAEKLSKTILKLFKEELD
ncbi:DNA cytosine methyltransferase [Enterococcus faecium]|uniref:DNA cytosine methyltransferase n=1 Tax=Enterococcus faecium TaxID=1352 RepID=UPI00214D4F4C|nr:DNA cytosine methyltransferase [Enterococcus faecium]